MQKTTDHEGSDSSETETRTISSKPKRRQFIKLNELILGVIFIAVVVFLATMLISNLVLKNDVNNAKAVSNQVVADINKRDGAAIRALGSPEFQRQYTAASLTQGFTAVEVATYKMPSLDQQIVVDTPDGRDVYFIYKYSALKVPFYVRTDIEHRSNHWYLTAIAGNIDESQLNGSN